MHNQFISIIETFFIIYTIYISIYFAVCCCYYIWLEYFCFYFVRNNKKATVNSIIYAVNYFLHKGWKRFQSAFNKNKKAVVVFSKKYKKESKNKRIGKWQYLERKLWLCCNGGCGNAKDISLSIPMKSFCIFIFHQQFVN